MRKILLSILLAGVAASPALAQDQDQDNGRWHHDRQQNDRGDRGDRGNRGQAHEERQQVREQVRETPQQRFNGGSFNAQQYQQRVAPQAEQRQQWQGRGNFGGQRWNGGNDAARQQQVIQQQQQQVVEQQQRQEYDRRNRDGQRQQWQGRNGYTGTYGGQVGTQQWRDRSGYTGTYRGTYGNQWQQRTQNYSGSRYANNWNRDWRSDRRYDWRRYRDSHRSVFRLGVYLDPFGYNYRPYDIGYQLAPVYYGQQYWIDPAMYDLPFPPPGTMWVRYWNDALLVDTYSGQVVDVLRDFFW